MDSVRQNICTENIFLSQKFRKVKREKIREPHTRRSITIRVLWALRGITYSERGNKIGSHLNEQALNYFREKKTHNLLLIYVKKTKNSFTISLLRSECSLTFRKE